jgi:undecaprenyl-diphosphatase
VTVFQAVLLGLVQGLTEFLPISSTGHLVLVQKILGFTQPPVVFDVLVHVATLVAVVTFFRRQLGEIINQTFQAFKSGRLDRVPAILPLIIIGTIPAIIFGLFLNRYIEWLFDSLWLVGVTWLINAGMLFLTKYLPTGKKNLSQITPGDATLIGVFQALAILPSISRSGATVVMALGRKLSRETAFTFSFLLSIPAIMGAAVLHLKDLGSAVDGEASVYVIGFVAAAVSGYVALRIFKRAVTEGKLGFFGAYCLVVGLLALGLFFMK